MSAYLRDDLDTAGEWESCRYSLMAFSLFRIFIWLDILEVQNLGVLQSDQFPQRYETGSRRNTKLAHVHFPAQ